MEDLLKVLKRIKENPLETPLDFEVSKFLPFTNTDDQAVHVLEIRGKGFIMSQKAMDEILDMTEEKENGRTETNHHK